MHCGTLTIFDSPVKHFPGESETRPKQLFRSYGPEPDGEGARVLG